MNRSIESNESMNHSILRFSILGFVLLLSFVEILQDCENYVRARLLLIVFIVSSGFKISGPRHRLLGKSWCLIGGSLGAGLENQNAVQMTRGATRFPNATRARRIVKRV
jgi:hypothetical protein